MFVNEYTYAIRIWSFQFLFPLNNYKKKQLAEAEVDLVWQRQRQAEAEVEKPHPSPGISCIRHWLT